MKVRVTFHHDSSRIGLCQLHFSQQSFSGFAQCQIFTSHKLDSGKLGDFCDGKLFEEHPLFEQDPGALQICLYYDDLEICNALGAKTKKHKLINIQITRVLAFKPICTHRSILLHAWEH